MSRCDETIDCINRMKPVIRATHIFPTGINIPNEALDYIHLLALRILTLAH